MIYLKIPESVKFFLLAIIFLGIDNALKFGIILELMLIPILAAGLWHIGNRDILKFSFIKGLLLKNMGTRDGDFVYKAYFRMFSRFIIYYLSLLYFWPFIILLPTTLLYESEENVGGN